MNKITAIVAALAVTANFIHAVDISYEAGMDQSIKKDKSMSVKKGSERRSSDRHFNTNSRASSSSADTTFDAVAIYTRVADECIRNPAMASDFGLGFEEDGVIDLNRKSFYENAGSAAMKLSKIESVDEKAIKKNIACIVYNSGRMAQANIILQKDLGGKSFTAEEIMRRAAAAWKNAAKPTNTMIVSQFNQVDKSLQSECRFYPGQNGSQSVKCGGLVYSFTDQTVKQSGVLLSPGEKFFGINSSFRVSLSNTNTNGNERADENSQSSSRDASLTQTGSNSMNRASKKTTNVSPFLPK